MLKFVLVKGKQGFSPSLENFSLFSYSSSDDQMDVSTRGFHSHVINSAVETSAVWPGSKSFSPDPYGARIFLTKFRVRTGGPQGNQMHIMNI